MKASTSWGLLLNTKGNPNVPFKYTVKMIDFAHVFPILDGGSDEGYYKGYFSFIIIFILLRLQNLTNFISDYLRKSYVLHSKPSNMDISHKDHLFEVCRSVKRREDIGGEFFAKVSILVFILLFTATTPGREPMQDCNSKSTLSNFLPIHIRPGLQ